MVLYRLFSAIIAIEKPAEYKALDMATDNLDQDSF